MQTVYRYIHHFIHNFFDTRKEKEDEQETIEALKQDADFRGVKMWILMCAIMIASLGLNVNSTAVIIGAMLISPLMGPIIGVGLGLAITDFTLVRQALKHFAMASVIGILTSTLYFLLSPIDTAQSELLARTQPTTYDVLIALFGGFAGIIAGASKSKGNVVPGVAIATALMPPLCTVGYGIATMQLSFSLGAIYLFLINAVFISLATFIGVKLLKYSKISYVDKTRGRRLNNLVTLIVILTIIPSIFLAAKMIHKSYQDERIRHFVMQELNIDATYLLSYKTTEDGDSLCLNVNLLGRPLSKNEVDVLEAKLSKYDLDKVRLNVRQDFSTLQAENIRSSIIKDLASTQHSRKELVELQKFYIDSLRTQLKRERSLGVTSMNKALDIKGLFPSIQWVDFSKTYRYRTDSIGINNSKIDTLTIVTLYAKKQLSMESQQLMSNWLHLHYPDAIVHFKKEQDLK